MIINRKTCFNIKHLFTEIYMKCCIINTNATFFKPKGQHLFPLTSSQMLAEHLTLCAIFLMNIAAL